MVSPQIEDGYTRIAHQLLDGIVASALTALELRIVLFVARKTYGARGSPKITTLSSRDIAVAVRTNERHAARTIKDLVSRRVLVEDAAPSFRSARRFGIQKDFEAWIGAPAPECLHGASLAPQRQSSLAPQRQSSLAPQRQSDDPETPAGVARAASLRQGETTGDIPPTPQGVDPQDSSTPDSGKPARVITAPALLAEELAAQWNKLAADLGLPQVSKLTEVRKRHAKARIDEGLLERWPAFEAGLRASAFHRGENDRDWRADFEWLLRPGKWLSIAEKGAATASGSDRDLPPGYVPTVNGPSPFDVAPDDWVPRTEKMRELWARHKAARSRS